MTIIIETPTTTRERLVLVPPDAVSRTEGGDELLTIRTANARDATPADLERGGYVPLAAFVGPLDLLSPPTLAGALEAIAHLRADLRDAVKERDELRHHYDAAGPEHNLLALLDSYESDADTARAQASAAYAMVVAAIGSVGAETIEAAVARLVADRGALLTRAEWGPESTMANARRAIYRLGVAHERARHVEKDRATDEELGRVFGEAYTVEESPDHGVALRTAYLAVAAHVRKERCLVAEAVGMGTGVTISRTSERVPGTTGMWDVYATRRPDVPGEHYAYGVPASDVPATLARLLGEVGRG